MKRPRGNGLASKICDVLADAPRPMFLGEIEAALDFQHGAAEIMSVLVKLQRAGKAKTELRDRAGPGRKVARAYMLAQNSMCI
ncbi:hypothetical protein [Chromobacterium haemolyticum]|uniref:hypothetical protein n=1 Tax=Chromobacterium haemolyticum TaxID=394935 RepID=UPI001316D83A|nr:hypothetical protein [Chromobacterium haemolyticum]BBH13389.1 hypothetical protein CH06BL_26370 [Chromobacterium haemolyticum]